MMRKRSVMIIKMMMNTMIEIMKTKKQAERIETKK